MTRKTNPEIVAEFAELLTEGAKRAAAKEAEDIYNPELNDPQRWLDMTKEWRSALWKKLKECEERMCPRPPEKSGSENCP